MRTSKRRFKFLWVTDPWDSLDHPFDTTLRLIQEASVLDLQIDNFWTDLHTIRRVAGETLLDAGSIRSLSSDRTLNSFSIGPLTPRSASFFDSIQYRPDPPIDSAYLRPLQLLVLGTTGGYNPTDHKDEQVEIVNSPNALFTTGEKLEAAECEEFTPATIISCNWAALLQFGLAEGQTILKPLDDAQGRGVDLLDWRTPEAIGNAERLLRKATVEFTSPILLQHYLPQVALEGELRLWFLDGHLLAHARKLPGDGDFIIRTNYRIERTVLTDIEVKAAKCISERLKLRRIRLAAVDLIDSQVTDFNFTSPGLLVELEAALGVNLARPIIESLAGIQLFCSNALQY